MDRAVHYSCKKDPVLNRQDSLEIDSILYFKAKLEACLQNTAQAAKAVGRKKF